MQQSHVAQISLFTQRDFVARCISFVALCKRTLTVDIVIDAENYFLAQLQAIHHKSFTLYCKNMSQRRRFSSG